MLSSDIQKHHSLSVNSSHNKKPALQGEVRALRSDTAHQIPSQEPTCRRTLKPKDSLARRRAFPLILISIAPHG